MISFDIETAPETDEVLERLLPPFQEPPHPGEFDPAAVKHGNTKDEEKKKTKEDAERAKHEVAVAEWEHEVVKGGLKHWEDFVENATKSPTTGRILAIFYASGKGSFCDDGSNGEGILPEIKLLNNFVSTGYQMLQDDRKMIGVNIFGFDLPFIVQRMWRHRINVPVWLLPERWRYWNKNLFTDLREVFLLGRQWGQTKSSFGEMAGHFGTPGKPEGVTGADFHKLYLSGDDDKKQQAIEYGLSDVVQPLEWAEAMGVS